MNRPREFSENAAAELRAALSTLGAGVTTAQETLATARGGAITAHDELFQEVDQVFAYDATGRTKAHSLLLRSSRASARVYDAVEALQSEMSAFVKLGEEHLLEKLAERETKVTNLQDKLNVVQVGPFRHDPIAFFSHSHSLS